jgi:integrase
MSRSGYELKLDANGVWYIHWSEGRRSKRVSTRARDRAEAEKVMAGLILEGDRRKDGDMPVSAVLDDYWNQHARNVESAVRIDIMIRHLREFFNDTLVSEIDRTALDGYSKQRRNADTADGTLRNELTCLTTAMRHCVREKRLDGHLVPHIALPTAPPAKERWLTAEEAGRLRAACGDSLRLRVFVEIALNTASRRAAIETLTWFQVDLTQRVINFNPPGRKQTKKRRAKVPISDALLPWLVRAKAEIKGEFVLGDRGSMFAAFNAAVKRAGLYKAGRENVTPHTLRHTWATWAAQSRVNLWEIAGVLGDTLATVERKYAHHHPDYLRDAVNFLKREVSDGAERKAGES